MKATELAKLFDNLSEMQTNLDAKTAATEHWQTLSRYLKANPHIAVGRLSDAIRKSQPSLHGDNTVLTLVSSVRTIVPFLAIYAKKAIVDDLNTLCSALDRHAAGTLEDLLAQAAKALTPAPRKAPETRHDLIALHLRNLEDSLGNERAFEAAFKALKADKNIKTPEAKQIAKDFSRESARSKMHALALVKQRHASLMESRAKSAATAGRTAA